MVLSPCRDSISGFLDSFQSGGALSDWRALTIERSAMSGCGQDHEPLTTVDECTHHATLAACYQLVQALFEVLRYSKKDG